MKAMKRWILQHKILAYLLGLILAMILVLLFAVETTRAPGPSTSNGNNNDAPIGVEMTIEGEVVCLPHKDTDGPQTMECAFGVKLDNGTYYALSDSKEDYSNVSSLPTGKRARLTGTLKQEPSDKYQSTGTLTVTKAEQLQ